MYCIPIHVFRSARSGQYITERHAVYTDFGQHHFATAPRSHRIRTLLYTFYQKLLITYKLGGLHDGKYVVQLKIELKCHLRSYAAQLICTK
jgi:hypothetical protein